MFVSVVITVLLSLSLIPSQKAKEAEPKDAGGQQVTNGKQVTPAAIPQPTTLPHQSNTNGANSQTPPNPRLYWGLTRGELVNSILTLAYVGISLAAFFAIKRQADLTEQQGESNAKEFSKQLQAMTEARQQTDTLISQAVAQVVALQTTADAARKSAEAAKSSADALIGSERAWVVIEFEWNKNLPHHYTIPEMYQNPVQTAVNLKLSCRNHGKTPAWVTAIYVRFGILDSLKLEPEIFNGDRIHYGIEVIAANHWLEFPLSQACAGVPNKDKPILIYGIVEYEDIFSEERKTYFGYWVTPEDAFVRLPTAYPEYNKAT